MSAMAEPMIAAISSIELISYMSCLCPSSKSLAGGEQDAAQESAAEVSAKGLVSGASRNGLTSSKSGGSASAAHVDEDTTSWSAP